MLRLDPDVPFALVECVCTAARDSGPNPHCAATRAGRPPFSGLGQRTSYPGAARMLVDDESPDFGGQVVFEQRAGRHMDPSNDAFAVAGDEDGVAGIRGDCAPTPLHLAGRGRIPELPRQRGDGFDVAGLHGANVHRSTFHADPRRQPQAYNPATGVAISIPERVVGDVAILDVPSQVMFYEGAELLRARINDLVAGGRLKFLLDLAQVTYLDSFGVGVIAGKYASIRRKGGDLKLLRPSARSQHVLGIAGLMKIFESFDDEDEAIRSFQSNVRT